MALQSYHCLHLRCNFNLKVALSPFTLAFPKGPMSHSLFLTKEILHLTVHKWSGKETWHVDHMCVLYIPLWLLRAKLSLISKAPHTKLLPLRKFIEATFCVASDQRKSWKKERQKRINAPNLQLCFQNQNSRRKGRKNSTFHKITAVEGSHFDLTSYNCNFPSLSFSPAFSISSKLSLL